MTRIKYYKLDTTVNLETVKFAYSKYIGEFITFLDVDDYWDQNKIIKQLGNFPGNKNIDMVIQIISNLVTVNLTKLKKTFSSFAERNYLSYKWETFAQPNFFDDRKECIDNLDYSFGNFTYLF